MKYELKKFKCKFNVDNEVEKDTKIKGDITNLIQVINNLIINAIHSYDNEEGQIDFKIVQKQENIEFSIRDYGKGIPEHVQDKLFKEMVTTKGRNGTGIGLYISYATVVGKFGGDMWFETEEGKGTTFYISIPCENKIDKGGSE